MFNDKELESPITDSLWVRCFFEIRENNLKKGSYDILLSDVDKLVVERSLLPIKELKKYLS